MYGAVACAWLLPVGVSIALGVSLSRAGLLRTRLHALRVIYLLSTRLLGPIPPAAHSLPHSPHSCTTC